MGFDEVTQHTHYFLLASFSYLTQYRVSPAGIEGLLLAIEVFQLLDSLRDLHPTSFASEPTFIASTYSATQPWSRRQDLNLRKSLRPKRSAITKLRYASISPEGDYISIGRS